LTLHNVPIALTIAGSDSGGGAGIQADLKTFAAFGVYGTSAITAVTAQNTQGVQSVMELPTDLVEAQIDSISDDIGFSVVKTGMLANAQIVEAVAAKANAFGGQQMIIDPVMIAASGDRLLHEDAIEAYRSLLLPLATVVTPNAPEAEALTGLRVTDRTTMQKAAEQIHTLGPQYVLVKGGHIDGPKASDVLFDGNSFKIFSDKRLHTSSTHGTGCTLASAIAAGLAHGRSVEESVKTAKSYVTGAIHSALAIGKGSGPINHMNKSWIEEYGLGQAHNTIS